MTPARAAVLVVLRAAERVLEAEPDDGAAALAAGEHLQAALGLLRAVPASAATGRTAAGLWAGRRL